MRDKPYYSARKGRVVNPELQLVHLRRLFVSVYTLFEERGYFQQHLGINCVDGFIAGTVGTDVEMYVLRKLRKDKLWPIWMYSDAYTEDDVFDIIEFLYDYASKPTDKGSYHDWNECGYHYTEFDAVRGKNEFRSEVNDFLRDYSSGFELSATGEILTLPSSDLRPILAADLPSVDPTNVDARIAAAVEKFRRRSSLPEDRRDAIRDLADVLEFLRPKLKEVLTTKDEKDLFNIVNNFGIRHHNAAQQTHYDKGIWYNWMFYFYLATIHAVARMLKKQKS